MGKDQGFSYHRHLSALPWLKQGLFTSLSPAAAFSAILERFQDEGFVISAQDWTLKRFSAYRRRSQGQCTCHHVVWVRTYGASTYISYGVDPRFLLFSFCRHGDHIEKLRACGQLVGTAVNYEGFYPG